MLVDSIVLKKGNVLAVIIGEGFSQVCALIFAQLIFVFYNSILFFIVQQNIRNQYSMSDFHLHFV